jgi:hypothetical protein
MCHSSLTYSAAAEADVNILKHTVFQQSRYTCAQSVDTSVFVLCIRIDPELSEFIFISVPC